MRLGACIIATLLLASCSGDKTASDDRDDDGAGHWGYEADNGPGSWGSMLRPSEKIMSRMKPRRNCNGRSDSLVNPVLQDFHHWHWKQTVSLYLLKWITGITSVR